MVGQSNNPTLIWIVIAIYGYLALYWLLAIRRSRHAVKRSLRTIALGALVAFLVYSISTRIPALATNAILIAAFAGIVVFVSKSSIARSRYIPVAVRRAVIERDLKGKPFDPTMHHIDHIWPFALGGGHTIDNLRVVERVQNLRKGKRRPRLREML